MSTVLVVTGQDDPTADAVLAELKQRPATVIRLDLGDFPAELRLSAEIADRAGWDGRLWTDGVEVDLAAVTAVYYRRPTRFRFPAGLSDADAIFAAAEARLGLGGVLGSLDALWVNHPARIAVAEYKPLQLRVARACGLRIPRTLVTNDHAALLRFAAGVSAPLICKTLSSLVLSEGGQAQAIFTTPIVPADIDPSALSVTAHLFQEQIIKDHEVRVTMVGPTPLAVAIRTDSVRGRVDWRADYDSLAYAIVEPPEQVTAAMVRYLSALGLNYGAFDFAVTAAGVWIMLECNPAGQWLWLSDCAGLPVAPALAALLTAEKA